MDSLNSFEEELRNISKTLDECNDGSMTNLMERVRQRRRATSGILATARTDTFTPPREARASVPRSSFQENATPPPAPVTTPATANSRYGDSTTSPLDTAGDDRPSSRARKTQQSPFYSSKDDMDRYVSKGRDVSFDLPPQRERREKEALFEEDSQQFPYQSGVSPIRGYQTQTDTYKDGNETSAYHQKRQQDDPLRSDCASERMKAPPNHHQRDHQGRNEWKDLVDAMRDTIDRQEALIDKLQMENRSLTRQLQMRRNDEYESNIRSAGSRTPPQRPAFYDENSRPPVDHRFSPGTKFVAELSRVMDLDPEVQVPLSLILDKQWERLSEVRQRHRWN